MTQLKIKNKPRCVNPFIVSVYQLNNDTIQINWSLNGIDYSAGSLLLEGSINGGATFVALQTIVPNNMTANISHSIFASAVNGQSILFRLTGNSSNCSDMRSEAFTLVWTKVAARNFDYNVKWGCSGRGDGPTNFDVTCQSDNSFKLSDVSGITGLFRMKNNADDYYISMTRASNGASIPNGQAIDGNEWVGISAFLTESNPSSYPSAYIPFPITTYTFEYSINNGFNWNEFTITFKE